MYVAVMTGIDTEGAEEGVDCGGDCEFRCDVGCFGDLSTGVYTTTPGYARGLGSEGDDEGDDSVAIALLARTNEDLELQKTGLQHVVPAPKGLHDFNPLLEGLERLDGVGSIQESNLRRLGGSPTPAPTPTLAPSDAPSGPPAPELAFLEWAKGSDANCDAYTCEDNRYFDGVKYFI